MLDALFNNFANGFVAGETPQAPMTEWDQMTLTADASAMLRELSEDRRMTAQDLAFQRKQQEFGRIWETYLNGLDSMQGTTFRGGEISGLEADLLRAEQEGWRQGWG